MTRALSVGFATLLFACVTSISAQNSSGEEPPRWVQLIRAGDIDRLVPPAGGYVGIGTGKTEEESIASAAVDFSATVSTTVTSTITERETVTEDETGREVTLDSEVRTQAVLTGMRPNVYRADDDQWYAMYRTTTADYESRLTEWLEVYSVMEEAARRQEIERLRRERFELEREAERERTEQRREELERRRREEERDRIAARERAFLTGAFAPVVLSIDTPGGAVDTFYTHATARFNRSEPSHVRTHLGVRLFQVLTFEAFAAGVREPAGDIEIPAVGFGAKARLVNNAGRATTVSFALGARTFTEPTGNGRAPWDDQLVIYGTASLRVPQTLHATYFAHVGNDRIAAGGEWAPLWNYFEDAITVSAALDIDIGFRRFGTREAWEPQFLAGIGFRPTETIRIGIYSENISTIGVAVSAGL